MIKKTKIGLIQSKSLGTIQSNIDLAIKNIKNELKKNSQTFPVTISSFGEDNLQELYVVDYMGTIYKFISN